MRSNDYRIAMNSFDDTKDSPISTAECNIPRSPRKAGMTADGYDPRKVKG